MGDITFLQVTKGTVRVFFLTSPQNSVCRYAAYETAFSLLLLPKSAKRLFPCEFKLVDSTLRGFKEEN